MSAATYLVSSSGQLSLPAAARHRWGLDEGGPVSVVDLGEVVVIGPGDAVMQRLLTDALTAQEHLDFVRDLDDDDLATT